MFRTLKSWLTAHKSNTSNTRLGMETLENRTVPTRWAVLDFDGEDTVTAAEFAEGGWGGVNALPTQPVTSFRDLFTSARPWLNRDGDGDVDGADFTRVRDDIVAKVRQDYAPYDLDIFVGDQDAYQNILTDGVVGDAMVFVTGGTDNIAAQIGQSQSVGWAPVDLGNTGDQMAFAFGRSIADSATVNGNYDRFVNWMARTISHEMGHTFGLEHITSTGWTDAQTHHLMNAPVDLNGDGDGRDWNEDQRDFTRDFGFQNWEYQTDSGPQNSHQLLRANLGDSTKAWAAVLLPGLLTVHGSAGNDWLAIRPSGSDWRVDIINSWGGTIASYHVDPSATPDIRSINPFDTAIHTVAIHGGNGDDRIEVGVAASNGVNVYAGAGNDVVFGGSGRDRIFGGGDHDILVGGGGNDYLYGEGGRDILIGGAGMDYLFGGADDNVLVGGNSTITGRLDQLSAMRTDWIGSGSTLTRGTAVKARFDLFTFADTEWDSVYGGSGYDVFFLSATDDNGATSTDSKYGV